MAKKIVTNSVIIFFVFVFMFPNSFATARNLSGIFPKVFLIIKDYYCL